MSGTGTGYRTRTTIAKLRISLYSDPIPVIGIFLSVILSLTLELTGVSSGADSILAGLMGITISLLLDSIARNERRFELRKILQAPTWLSDALPDVAESAQKISIKYGGTPIPAELKLRFDRFESDFEELGKGQITRPGADYEHLISSTIGCERRLDAITNFQNRRQGEVSWWSTEVGRQYWQANLDAIQRGVAITRLFAYTKMTDDLRNIVQEQRTAGVKVGLVRIGSVDSSMHPNLAIWDGTSTWEGRMNAHGEIVANVFSVNRHDVDRLENMFKVCRMSASSS